MGLSLIGIFVLKRLTLYCACVRRNLRTLWVVLIQI